MEAEARLDPESLRKIISMAREAEPALKRHVYAGIREAAGPAAEAARDAVLSGPGGTGRAWRPVRSYTRKGGLSRTGGRGTVQRGSGLRSGIAAGVAIGLGSGIYTMGVRITSSSKNLRADQYRMNRTYDKPTFRHPVFGRGSVAQAGKEWFYGPIEAQRGQFTDAVAKAMEKAAEELA